MVELVMILTDGVSAVAVAVLQLGAEEQAEAFPLHIQVLHAPCHLQTFYYSKF
jgi:hypothetical protein